MNVNVIRTSDIWTLGQIEIGELFMSNKIVYMKVKSASDNVVNLSSGFCQWMEPDVAVTKVRAAKLDVEISS